MTKGKRELIHVPKPLEPEEKSRRNTKALGIKILMSLKRDYIPTEIL